MGLCFLLDMHNDANVYELVYMIQVMFWLRRGINRPKRRRAKGSTMICVFVGMYDFGIMVNV
jgi:hypothetical protein